MVHHLSMTTLWTRVTCKKKVRRLPTLRYTTEDNQEKKKKKKVEEFLRALTFPKRRRREHAKMAAKKKMKQKNLFKVVHVLFFSRYSFLFLVEAVSR